MKLDFAKYNGAGNDFIMIDNMSGDLMLTECQIATLCDRHFGIGADGLIALSPSRQADFKMDYYNCDGRLASFCGNGGRCTAAYAYSRGIAGPKMCFEGFDGLHHALVGNLDEKGCTVELEMRDVGSYRLTPEGYLVVNTGSPHLVVRVENLDDYDVVGEGRRLRNDKSISEDGVNVNFIVKDGDWIRVRTYERGVEDETLACGTGVTASAIAASVWFGFSSTKVVALGGVLNVRIERNGSAFRNIVLEGPARKSFDGKTII